MQSNISLFGKQRGFVLTIMTVSIILILHVMSFTDLGAVPAFEWVINNGPVFTEGADPARAVAENTVAGVNIGAPISATDADGDALTYTLSGTDAVAFSIDSTTGQLRTQAALDYETKATYAVTITVSDGNGGSDIITLTVNVTDANDVPVFTEGSQTTRSVAENTPPNINIGNPVSATDADGDVLTYGLGGNPDAAAFRILSTTGQLQTKAALDFETQATYTVVVSVSDGNGGGDSIAVTINVTDVKERPPRTPNRAPVFTEGSSTTRTVPETTPSGRNIGSPIAATDADNDTLTYSLSGTDATGFRILSTSGQLQTSAALDYETKTSYTVTVSVSDGKGGSDSITVTINVRDVAELPDGITPIRQRTPQVRDAIVAAVPGVNNPDNVTAAHLEAITSLRIMDEGITALKSGDFDGFTKMTKLYLAHNSIHDISPLEDLTSLKELYLTDNSIGNISPLEDLTNLTTLSLSFNSIGNISPLEGMTNLTTLYLHVNCIRDISPLADLTKLTWLELYDNSISDISPLADLTKLKTLELHNNSISDISPLADLTKLTWLELYNNSISDISPLADLTALEYLYLYNNSIHDISPLADLTKLTWLELYGNSISDISPLEDLTKLKTLELHNNSISDISPLADLTALEYLYMHDNSIHDISPLENLTNLKQLLLRRNPISDYAPLRRLKTAVENAGNSISIDIDMTNNPPVFTDGPSTTRAIAENTAAGTNIGTAVSATDIDNHTLTYSLGGTDADAFDIVSTSGQLETKDALDFETKSSYTLTLTVYDGNHGGDRITVTIDVTDVVNEAVVDENVRAAPPVETSPIIPDQTALLTNFPNPFNPETWIPYQLAKPAEVTLTIYDIRGVVVHELRLGHKAAGVYTHRSRAIHWDGRNQLGEPVVSGVYFYTLSAGDFTATRKMLIQK